jgi:mannose PTS system EIID component
VVALRRSDLARSFARSLWIQASWSFEGMQSVGFAYALEPVLARLYRGEELRRARERHLEFFNTHPYLAAAVIGCVARLEEVGGPDAEATIRRVKTGLMGPCGAMGDSFCWGSLKPFLVLVCLHAAYRGETWAPWVFVCGYGSIALAGRAYLFREGYRRGLGVVDTMDRLNLLVASRTLKLLCALLLGALLAYVGGAERFGISGGAEVFVWGAGVFAVALALSWGIGRGLNPTWLVYAAAALAAGTLAWT